MRQPIRNRLHGATAREWSATASVLNGDNSTWVVAWDGRTIRTWTDYMAAIRRDFQFPRPYDDDDNIDGYLDWMTDLEWLHKVSYVLAIEHFQAFMADDPMGKRRVIQGPGVTPPSPGTAGS